MSKNKKGNVFSIMYFRTFTTVMVGMFTFGFVDNFILIIAGESIDNTIAQTFGFSTMFSAGIGNAISDAVGVLSGSLMSSFVYKCFGKVKEDEISENAMLLSQTIGVFLGCIAGLIPLLFL